MAMMKPNETRFASPGSSSSLSDMALEAQNSPRAVIRTQQQGTSSSSRRGSPRSSTRTSSRPNSIVGGRAAVTAPVVPCSSAGRTPQTRRKELTVNNHLTSSNNSPTGSPRNGPRVSSGSSSAVKRARPNNSSLNAGNSCVNSSGNNSSHNANNINNNNGSNNNNHNSSGSSNNNINNMNNSSSSNNINNNNNNNNNNINNSQVISNNNINKNGAKKTVKPKRPSLHGIGGPGSAEDRWKTTSSPFEPECEVRNAKFKELWDVKTIEQGMIRVPTKFLQDLIHNESIEKYFDIEEKPVASGLFATVRKCTHRETGIQYAAKFSSRIRCGVDCSMEVLHEIAMLYICNESNKIVHLKDVFQNRYEIILVLEYAPGGDFQSVLDEDMVPFEEDVQGFLKQIIEALKFIHDKDIAHLDIKPQNIVLMGQFPNCEIKLCDLEVARVIQKGESIREIIGTPDYVAPEILSLDSITLAADIWSLGVLAYVLLTGFSPFGGDSDQETLRNISNAQLDFPSELFEGVSDQAKDFISQCLKRKPSERPTIKECLQHQWLVEDEEPPSPSPLMLKIPTPDTFKTHHPSHSTSPQGSTHHLNSHATTGASRRSCQTCRDRVTERKRYLSKSREAIFEKVAQSNLKKSLSKSRERLCDMRLTLSKSREYLSDKAQDQKSISKSQEKLPNFKSLSKSQEVISNALGGAMKRMSNGAGAVSDISQALLSMDSGNGLDLLLLPGNQILSKNNGSLQLLPFTEQMLAKTDLETRTECPVEPIIIVNEPILEVHEEEEDEEEKEEEEPEDVKKEDTEEPKEDNKKEEGDERKEISQNEQSSTETGHETSTIGKDEQGSKDSMVFKEGIVSSENSTPSPTPGDGAKSVKNESARTNSIGVQVNIAPNETLDPHAVTRRAGFNHSSTLGARRAKAQPWRNELGKIKLHKKVSELIGTFDRSENNVDTLEELKLKRRGSLQIEGDINITGHEVADILAAERKLKLQRRKSTSAILNTPISDMTILNLKDILLDGPKETVTDKDAKDVKKTEEDVPKKDSTLNPTQTGGTPANVPQTTSTPLGTKAKNWDYFEIDHPKAISEKKLQQLKAKYLRRKTEASMSNSRTTSTIKEEDEKNAAGPEQKRPSEHRKVRPPPPPPPPPEVRLEAKPPPTRSNSVPIVQGINIQSVKSEGLQLSIDPLTSQCMDKEQETPQSIFLSVVTRKTSSDSNLDVAEAMSRKSSSGSIRRKTSNLENIEEHAIPDNHVLQVSIDPFTGRFETCEIEKRPGKPQVSVKLAKSTTEDDGFGSLPHSPIEQKLEQSLGESLTQSRLDDDGVFTSSEEVLNAIQRDEMTDSLPTTSSQPSGSTDSLSGLFFHQRLEKVQFHNDNDDDDDSDTTNPPHDPNNTDQHHNQ